MHHDNSNTHGLNIKEHVHTRTMSQTIKTSLDVKEPAHTRFVVSLIYKRTTTPEWRALVLHFGYVPR
jgi:hypothetical protein